MKLLILIPPQGQTPLVDDSPGSHSIVPIFPRQEDMFYSHHFACPMFDGDDGH